MKKNKHFTLTIPIQNDFYLYDNTFKLRHESALPPKEAYLYFPSNDDIVLYNPSKPEKLLRRIFSGVTFTPYENNKYNELQRQINQRGIKLPQWWQESESRRFLQATAFDIDKAILHIQRQIAWRSTYFPFTISNHIVEILNTGFMYIHGRDMCYRPVFIIQAKIYSEISIRYTYDELFMTIIYFLEYIINNLLIIGQVENWIMISDLTDVNVLFMPRDLKRLIDALSSCYRCRLYKNFILGLSTGMRWLFNIVTSCIDGVTMQKISVLENGKWDVIKGFIREDNLELKFGGKAKDVIKGDNNYFPPVMPMIMTSESYCSSTDTDTAIGTGVGLITELEYKQRWYNKKSILDLPLVIGPYYKEKWEREEIEEKIKEERRKRKEKSIYNKKKIDLLGANIPSELRDEDNCRRYISGTMLIGLKEIIKYDMMNNTSPFHAKKLAYSVSLNKEEGLLSDTMY